jgi:MFS family permease
VSTVFPGFLIGALSVQVSSDLGVSEATYGWGLGSFFLAATAGSILLGHLVQRIGPRNQITLALGVSALAQLALATTAQSFGVVVALLAVAGATNAANQTAVNLALTRADVPRLGLAVAVKQSGMPSASMLAGIAVPALALTAGWRWAYVMGAVLAILSLVSVRFAIEATPPLTTTDRTVPVSSSRALFLAAASGGFLSFSAGALNAWVVGSGVDAGLGPGMAGAALSLGAACGIALRLYSGIRADRMRTRPFRVAGLSALVGAVGMASLAIRAPAAHIAATLLAFAAGWVWPVFTNFGIVRTNPAAAGAVTGVTQMGVYVGVFTAPLVTGQLISRSGYQLMWMVVAATAVVGSVIAIRIADEF